MSPTCCGAAAAQAAPCCSKGTPLQLLQFAVAAAGVDAVASRGRSSGCCNAVCCCCGLQQRPLLQHWWSVWGDRLRLARPVAAAAAVAVTAAAAAPVGKAAAGEFGVYPTPVSLLLLLLWVELLLRQEQLLHCCLGIFIRPRPRQSL